jgi:RNA polymerase sigma-70 factor, ECF subfamily
MSGCMIDGDDRAHIANALRGNRDAFGSLVRKYQRRVYAAAFRLTGNHSDADDVAQDSFLRAYRGLGAFDGRAEFFTWLYRIVVNTALNHLRARKRTRATSAGLPADDVEAADDTLEMAAAATDEAAARVAAGSTDPRALAESRQALAAAGEALAELAPTLRITLVMATIEELPYKQIAELLGIPEGTVAWRVNQARKELRHRLSELAPGPPTRHNDGSLRNGQDQRNDAVHRGKKQALGVR